MAFQRDIRKLRQRNILGDPPPIGDITSGDMDMSIQPPVTKPTFQSGGTRSFEEPRSENLTRIADAQKPTVEREDIRSLADQLNSIYTPDTTSRDRLNRLLDAYPERESPGWARRLVASGAGLRSKDPLKTMEDIMYAPHLRELSDWKDRTGPYQQAAQIENTANVNERTLAGNILNAKTQADKLAVQEQYNRDRSEVALIRANAYRAKQEGAEIKIEEGRVVAYHNAGPKAGQVEFLGKVPGSSTDAELADIRGRWAVKAAEARGETAQATANIRGYQPAQDEQGNVYVIDPATKSITPVGDAPPMPVGQLRSITGTPRQPAVPKPPTKAETDQQIQQKLLEIYNRSPDSVNGDAKWLVGDVQSGTLRLKPRPVETWANRNTIAADQEHYDRVRKQVYPDYTPPTAPPTAPPARTGGPGPTGAQSPARPNVPTKPAGVGPITNTQFSKSQPKEGRRSRDGGKTWEYTHDGGQTWGPQ